VGIQNLACLPRSQPRSILCSAPSGQHHAIAPHIQYLHLVYVHQAATSSWTLYGGSLHLGLQNTEAAPKFLYRTLNIYSTLRRKCSKMPDDSKGQVYDTPGVCGVGVGGDLAPEVGVLCSEKVHLPLQSRHQRLVRIHLGAYLLRTATRSSQRILSNLQSAKTVQHTLSCIISAPHDNTELWTSAACIHEAIRTSRLRTHRADARLQLKECIQ
jgi:hypothetical protein